MPPNRSEQINRGEKMISHWLKPNKVGIAFFGIFGFSVLFYYALFVMLPRHWSLYPGWAIALLAAYPILMSCGRSIEARRKLRSESAGKEPLRENRLLEWLCLVAFLIIAAIPLELGCYLLSPASYFRHFSPPPSMGLHRPVLFWFAYGLPIALPIVLKIMRWNTAFIIFLTGAILIERLCAQITWHTIGEVTSWYYHLFIFVNIIPMLLYSAKFRRTAAIIILAFGLWFVPEKLSQGYHFIQFQDEAHAIVEYVYETMAQTGSYPEDLSGYSFMEPVFEKHIQEYKPGDNNFTLMYYIESAGASHWYDSSDGWHYYPD